MAMTLRDLAALVGGRVVGDESLEILGAATIRDAKPGDITFADSAKFATQLAACSASAVVVGEGLGELPLPAIVVGQVSDAFARIVREFRPQWGAAPVGISPQATISPSAKLAADVTVHPGATIGDGVEVGSGATIHSGVRILAGCRIGENCTLFPNSVLYENTVLGPRVIVHAGAVLGAYGFGYATKGGRHILSPQLGNVEIGADVEIGAGTTIDRGTYGPTTIGEGTKIDNQVMIGHNCRIGRHNMICSQVGIAGSCTTGDYVVMAGQVGVRDHVNIGTGAIVGAKAGVMNDLAPGNRYLGAPALLERDEMRLVAALVKLPELRKEVRELRRQLEASEKSTGATQAPQPAESHSDAA